MVSGLLHLVIVDILSTGVAPRPGSAAVQPLLQELEKNLRARLYVSDNTPSTP